MNIKKELLPQARLPITQKALNKAETTARLVAEAYGSPVESIGFLLTDQVDHGPDRVITDVILGHDQTISPGTVQISPTGVLASGREIERKKLYTMGWTHAHPHDTFHSATDVDNMGVVLNDLAAGNAWPLQEPKQAAVCWEGEALIIRTPTETIRLTGGALAALRPASMPDEAEIQGASGDAALDLRAVIHSSALVASCAYSLVVSATGRKPYAEMATRVYCAVCGHNEEQTTQVPIEIIDLDPLNLEELRAEIRRKVKNLPPREETAFSVKMPILERLEKYVKGGNGRQANREDAQTECQEVREGE